MGCYSNPTPTNETPAILEAKDVQNLLKCGLSTVYDLFEAGELRGFRLKGGVKKSGIRFYAESVNELMTRNANATKPASPPPEPAAVAPLPPKRRVRPAKVTPAAGLLSVRPQKS